MNQKGNSYAWRALIAGCIMCGVWVGITGNTLPLYAEYAVKEIGISRSQYMLATVTIVGIANATISFFFYGKLHAMMGLRRLLLVFGIVGSVGFLLYGRASSFAVLMLGGLLYGISCSINSTGNTLPVMINNWFKKNTGRYISIGQTCASVFGIVFATVFAQMIAHLGWRMPLIITAVLGLISTVLIILLYRGEPETLGVEPMYADEAADPAQKAADAEMAEKSSETEAEDGLGFAESLRNPKFILLIAVYFLLGGLGFAPFSNFALVASDLGYAAHSGTLISVYLAASAISLIPMGVLIDKTRSRVVVSLCMACLIAVFVLFRLNLVNVPIMYVCAALLGVEYNVWMLPGSFSVRELLGSKDFARKVSVVTGATIAGLAIIPAVMSGFYDLTGSYNLAFVIFSIVAAVIMVLIHPLTTRAA